MRPRRERRRRCPSGSLPWCSPYLRCAFGDELVHGAVPLLQEFMSVEHVIAADRRGSCLRTIATDDGEAVLAAHTACELDDESVGFRGDPPDRAALESGAAAGTLHLADAFEDRADPVHRGFFPAQRSPPGELARRVVGRTRAGYACPASSVAKAPMSAPDIRASDTRSF